MRKITLPESFPNLPASIQKIQQLYILGDIDAHKLLEILDGEPLLCANILKLVNSPYYGLSKKVTSVNHAIMLLGMTVTRGIIMASMLKKSFPLDLSPYNISIEQFDQICVLRVRLLNEWLKGENIDLQTLSAAAFLMESGIIITSHEIINNDLKEIFLDMLQKTTIEEAETSLFEIDSYQIAAILFQQWQFDDAFTEMISGIPEASTKQQQILRVLCTSINVRCVLNDLDIVKAKLLVEEHGLNLQSFEKAIGTLKAEL